MKGYFPTRFMLPSSRYDKRLADHAVQFISLLKHTNTDWAGKPFELIDWQERIVRDVFGIVDRQDGTRQIRTVYIEIPKKQGKSELCAAIALYLLCADGEFGAQIYGCARDGKQSRVIFDVARDMMLQDLTLRKLCKLNETQKRIIYLPTRSYYEAVSAEVQNKQGLNVHACIFDEFLTQPDRRLYDVMTKGSGAARRQPLNFIITTAGTDRTSICWELHQKAVDILEGRKIDSTFYPVVYAAPQEADWTDPAVWKACNPSYGITVPEKEMFRQYESARESAADELRFRRDFLCQWTNAETRWIPMDKYDACGEAFDVDALKGRECYGGLDLANTDDVAAFVLVFPPAEGDDKYYILPHFWVPEESVARRSRQDSLLYDRWAREKHLHATEGNVIHYDHIEKEIVRLGEKYNIREIAFDDWGAYQMAQNLENEGFLMTKFMQRMKSLSPPSKELYRLILSEKIRHGGHPVLRWMFENVVVETDASANIRPNKQKSSEKIDGVVAAIMALDRVLRHENKRSVYDERGVLSVGPNGVELFDPEKGCYVPYVDEKKKGKSPENAPEPPPAPPPKQQGFRAYTGTKQPMN